MDMLSELYYKSVTENERNLQFWDEYLQNLKSLNFNEYRDKLKVPVLVPIGSRILFKGELKHTNEITVALGADYFAKCSLAQAEILRQHRIRVVQEKVDAYNKERDYLQNQIAFTKLNVYEEQGEEIIEYHTEVEDKAWRIKHIQNVKEYMQRRAKEKENEHHKDDVTDKELFERLEELELQEELQSELNNMNDDNFNLSKVKDQKVEPLVVKEEENLNFSKMKGEPNHNIDEVKLQKEINNKNVSYNESKAPEQRSKLDLLQQVIDRQNDLDEKLHELKNRERSQCKTKQDLISRLDELEQLDELEDEMDRLDDIIENEDVEVSEEEETSKSEAAKLERRVSFVDDDDCETLNLTFKHSKVAPNNEPYDPQKGIQKPSDIYEAHANLFGNGITSILKKSKYASDDVEPDKVTSKPVDEVKKTARVQTQQPVRETPTIIVKDIVEKVGQNNNKIQKETKPISLFKKKRMQNK
ncbi:unnamed protein product [Arctia plantaginis]|uniref:Unconventional prefoldin RPB5 interactor n=1 Tax=Arctia plantaginis TaxID=874455 RepID=A0A8S1A4N5_ARCPL|nr:unnamed protein product [Arctia plantaginis]